MQTQLIDWNDNTIRAERYVPTIINKPNNAIQNAVYPGVGNKSGQCYDITDEIRCNRTERCTWEGGQCVAMHSFLDAMHFNLVKQTVVSDLNRIKNEYKSEAQKKINASKVPSSEKTILLNELHKHESIANISADKYKTLRAELERKVRAASSMILSRRNDFITSIFTEAGDPVLVRLWRYFLKFSKQGRLTLATRMRKKVLAQIQNVFRAKKINVNTYAMVKYEITHFQIGQWTDYALPKQMGFHEWDAMRGSYEIQPPSPDEPKKSTANANKKGKRVQKGIRNNDQDRHEDDESKRKKTPPSSKKDPLKNQLDAVHKLVEELSAGVDPEQITNAVKRVMADVPKPRDETGWYLDMVRTRDPLQMEQSNPRVSTSSKPKSTSKTKKRASNAKTSNAKTSNTNAKTSNTKTSNTKKRASSLSLSEKQESGSLSLFHALEPVVTGLGAGTAMTSDIIAASLSHVDVSSYRRSFLLCLKMIQKESFDVSEAVLEKSVHTFKTTVVPALQKTAGDIRDKVGEMGDVFIEDLAASEGVRVLSRGTILAAQTLFPDKNARQATIRKARKWLAETEEVVYSMAKHKGAQVANKGAQVANKGAQVANKGAQVTMAVVNKGAQVANKGAQVTMAVANKGAKGVYQTVNATRKTVNAVKKGATSATVWMQENALKPAVSSVGGAVQTSADILAHEMATAVQKLPSVREVLDCAHTITAYAVETGTPVATTTANYIGKAFKTWGGMCLSSSLSMSQYFLRMGELILASALERVELNSDIYLVDAPEPTREREKDQEQEQEQELPDVNVESDEKQVRTRQTSMHSASSGPRVRHWRQTDQRVYRENPHAFHTVTVPLKTGEEQQVRRSTRIRRHN